MLMKQGSKVWQQRRAIKNILRQARPDAADATAVAELVAARDDRTGLYNGVG